MLHDLFQFHAIEKRGSSSILDAFQPFQHSWEWMSEIHICINQWMNLSIFIYASNNISSGTIQQTKHNTHTHTQTSWILVTESYCRFNVTVSISSAQMCLVYIFFLLRWLMRVSPNRRVLLCVAFVWLSRPEITNNQF